MNSQELCKVWDLPLRIFHWLLVIGFLICYVTEDELLAVHVWSGYGVFGLLCFRLLWGFLGSKYARFSSFPCKPTAAIRYLQDLRHKTATRYLGHNPAGAMMIVFLLISLLITTLTGVAVYGADQNAGPLAGIGSANEALWEDLHELFANFTVALVIFHIIGVIVESYLHGENLVKSMWSGYKKPSDQ